MREAPVRRQLWLMEYSPAVVGLLQWCPREGEWWPPWGLFSLGGCLGTVQLRSPLQSMLQVSCCTSHWEGADQVLQKSDGITQEVCWWRQGSFGVVGLCSFCPVPSCWLPEQLPYCLGKYRWGSWLPWSRESTVPSRWMWLPPALPYCTTCPA